MQSSADKKNINIEDYSELIKTVARVEYSRLSTSKHLLDYSELVNIGATAVYVILSTRPKSQHNNSYISTAIKWSIRNELRRRFKWYSSKKHPKENEDYPKPGREELREKVYGTILSIDELENSECPVQIEDGNLNPEERIELIELKKAIIKAMEFLAPKEREVLESKFFKNKKVREIADEMNVSPSRISKIIQAALDKVKARLIKEGVI